MLRFLLFLVTSGVLLFEFVNCGLIYPASAGIHLQPYQFYISSPVPGPAVYALRYSYYGPQQQQSASFYIPYTYSSTLSNVVGPSTLFNAASVGADNFLDITRNHELKHHHPDHHGTGYDDGFDEKIQQSAILAVQPPQAPSVAPSPLLIPSPNQDQIMLTTAKKNAELPEIPTSENTLIKTPNHQLLSNYLGFSAPSIVYSTNPIPLTTAVTAAATSTRPTSAQFHQQDNMGQYYYGYANPHSAKQEIQTLDGVTRGSYSYIDANGILQTVSYISDDVNGFRVAATNLPKAPTSLPESNQNIHNNDNNAAVPLPVPLDTPEIEQAKKEHFLAQQLALEHLNAVNSMDKHNNDVTADQSQ